MVQVLLSKFTLGIEAHQTQFQKGDEVTYELLNGQRLQVTIQSDFMHHARARIGGYEAIFSDDNKLAFADIERIVDWPGKV